MARKLPTGITSRVNDSGGKSRRQYRASLSDPSQKDVTALRARRVTSRWFESLAEARDWREAKLVQLRSVGTLAQNSKLTVAEASEAWIKLAEKVGVDGRSPIEFATADRYRSSLRNVISPSIGSMRLSEFTAPMVIKWRDQLVLEHGNDSARRALGLFKMVTRYHVTIGDLLIDPAASVRLSKASNASDDDDEYQGAVEEFLSSEDVARILAAVDRITATGEMHSDTGRGMGDYQRRQRMEAWGWVRPLVYLLVSGGLRMGEASALRWGDVDWEADTITVVRALKRGRKIGAPKNRTSVRSVKLSPEFMAVLRQLYVAKNDRDLADYIFGGNPKRPLNDHNFRERQWHDLMVECDMVTDDGENLWTPHDLRHYFASYLILNGGLVEKVADLLGHADTTVTQKVYVHLFRSMQGKNNTLAADLGKGLLGR